MKLTVPSVAYPLAPLSADTAGGAGRIVAALDRGSTLRGHRSPVVAAQDSRAAARFPAPAGLRKKGRLLGAARCVSIPSAAPETSSLLAMAALACGTPVIAFVRGALAENRRTRRTRQDRLHCPRRRRNERRDPASSGNRPGGAPRRRANSIQFSQQTSSQQTFSQQTFHSKQWSRNTMPRTEVEGSS